MVVKHDNTTRFLDRKDGHEHELTSGILVNTCHGVVYTSTVCNIHWYPIIIYNLHNIYTWKTYGHFFCPLWVLPVTDVFFCSIAYFWFLIVEGLFKSFDNTVFGHPPTISKRGISVQSGANWESWSGTQIWPQILPYFPPNLDVPIKYQYFST